MTAPEATLESALEELAARLAGGTGPLLLRADDLQVHRRAIEELTEDPRGTTSALVSRAANCDLRIPPAHGGPSAGVRRRGGRVVSAGSAAHQVTGADAVFTGALLVSEVDRPTAAAAARQAADAARTAGWDGDALDVLVVALVRGGIPVRSVLVDPWPWRRGADGTERARFQAEVDRTDDPEVHRLRLARATKADDGLVATVLSRPLARSLTPLALRAGLTPNTVTLISALLGLAAAACFATGDRLALVAGAVLLQLSLVVDCVDGDVARYTRRFSAQGAWLDAATDRIKEFACYGGLAWGSGEGSEAWLVAAAMLTLQTARHTVDYTFTAVKEDREGESGRLPLEQVDDGVPAGASAVSARAARAVDASERSNRRPAVRWTKKALHLGIGERWLVLSVLAAAGRPMAALVVLLVLGLASLAYTSTGRALRARSWPATTPSPREREIVRAQADLGPLVPAAVAAGMARSGPGGGRFLWVRPALLRVAEYAAVVGVVAAVSRDLLGPAFALLLVVASHHYDDLYRVLQGLPPAGRSAWLGLGAPGRVLLVAVLAALGPDALEGGLWALAAALGILYVVVEPVRLLRDVRERAAADPVPEAAGG
ncbi:MAG TPA: DUF5941 domain-containing protein [Actinomycetes bacterium]